MHQYHRIAVLIFICAGIVSIQVFSYEPFWSSIHKRPENDDDGAYSSFLNMIPLRIGTPKESTKEVFAPILIGVGLARTTDGVHLFTEVTCKLGFVSLQYNIGCVPSNALSLKTKTQQQSISNGTNTTCQIDNFTSSYTDLFTAHSSISDEFKRASRNVADPSRFTRNILQKLERIIKWGKEHRIGLALHDAPYTLLMPEILKLVQKHYVNDADGEQQVVAKPIILLSVSDPEEYVRQHTEEDMNNWLLCWPTHDQNATNSSSIAVEEMNNVTLEGGAFDIIGCIEKVAASAKNNSQNLNSKEVVYSMKQADQLSQSQYIIDSFERYQAALEEISIFSTHSNENSPNDTELAAQVKQAMVEALVKKDGHHQLRMKGGFDYVGFDSFFASIDATPDVVSEEKNSHRRRHHGDKYDDTQNDGRTATLDNILSSMDNSNHNSLILVDIIKKKVFSEDRKQCHKK